LRKVTVLTELPEAAALELMSKADSQISFAKARRREEMAYECILSSGVCTGYCGKYTDRRKAPGKRRALIFRFQPPTSIALAAWPWPRPRPQQSVFLVKARTVEDVLLGYRRCGRTTSPTLTQRKRRCKNPTIGVRNKTKSWNGRTNRRCCQMVSRVLTSPTQCTHMLFSVTCLPRPLDVSFD
jgi:hypothetical protein